ncbi:MAG: 23S rRNA (adenine(2503)-C(2))-methyltransferase RlmN, partial [Alphaproteobacteria bacterium]|nr:23S rRNA (adenine(2503)-C(2))-methyltransferase RlmN [Alphaproteobacteria bacterium]
MTAEKPSLIGLSRAELEALLASHGFERFRARQVWQWMYAKGATDFAQMSSISKPQQQKLAGLFTLARARVAREHASLDGTRKWLLEFNDGNQVETVFIPSVTERTAALCVSSQVGCTLSCSFCHTGTMKLVRNLTPGDIVSQVMVARDALGEWGKKEGERSFTNIVMMGMGEPLYNYENVAAALKVVMDGEGIAISKRRITLSTSGVVPEIERCGRELNVNLAISLHAVRDELRDVLVPLNRKWPIAALLDACRRYPGLSNARRITFEYVM